MRQRVKEFMRGYAFKDTSFLPTNGFEHIVYKNKLKKHREIWLKGVEVGYEHGLYDGSIEGQVMNMSATLSKDPNDRASLFYKEYLELTQRYNCSITYHPRYGMSVVKLNKN